MKNALPIVAILIALGSLVYSNSKISGQKAELEKKLAALSSSDELVHSGEEEIEVADYMRALQWNVNKLYFAGKSSNKELMEFYVHELEEVSEDVAYAGIMDDKIPVSKNMKSYGLKGIENFEKRMNTDFHSAYLDLISTCNACHLACEHEFIKIIEPTHPISDNQEF